MSKKIYVLAPYGLITGGPDALHQLVYYLNKIGADAEMVYVNITSKSQKIAKEYAPYIDTYGILKDISDTKENIVIVPETLHHLLSKYQNVQKYIWWLSVDNDLKLGGESKIKLMAKKLFSKGFFKKYCHLYKMRTFIDVLKHKAYSFNEETEVTHLCASYYAYDYVSRKTTRNVIRCIEPISLFFLQQGECTDRNDRKSVVLYNPKKNFLFTQKIVEKNPDLEFLPLSGYTQQQLVDLFRASKVYIDFGGFPGAERLPKEAVLNGCAIVTGRYGASAYDGDVPIDDCYKFDATEENIEKISDTIHRLLEQYEERFCDFDRYRKTVKGLESNFTEVLAKEFLNE